jgi:hypothetical protein
MFKNLICAVLILSLSHLVPIRISQKTVLKKSPWFQSASEPSDRRLSAKLVPTLADRECRVVSATNPHGC